MAIPAPRGAGIRTDRRDPPAVDPLGGPYPFITDSRTAWDPGHWLLAGQVLSPGQCLGAAMVLATLVLAGPAGHRRATAAAVRTHDVLGRSVSPR
ncbi:hypothetical protein NNX28_02515 [Arthrobacter sp. zg-Y859]|uniref:Uncharacterized protein n=1 Tax=Arthrobacter jinronghuae TaxID=2964609 RepID=A0ABT1NM57_9MICC|nr:hypothetical protein [Arthrobacter jinronghuae]MCQ1948801.1 hypothetical protein [Arthrobacter jinronghuae]UWX78389.1 hypothetical protein N2K98_15750 [Arthrobacter jinronghuae]